MRQTASRGRLVERVAREAGTALARVHTVLPKGSVVELPSGFTVAEKAARLPLTEGLRVMATGRALKAAVTAVSLLIVSWHIQLPEQPRPLQPANVESAEGFAVSVTCEPAG